LLLSPDGRAEHRGEGNAAIPDAVALGRKIGEELRKDAVPEFGLP
jgi:hypothetical protein